MPDLKQLKEAFDSPFNMIRMGEDLVRLTMYNGKLKKIIEENIAKEFKKPETIEQLNHRIIPINFVRKIIDKSSTVYMSAPIRRVVNKKPSDAELLAAYEKSNDINQRGKWANRLVNLSKNCLYQPFVDHLGIPRLRICPPTNYMVFSDDPIQPERMTHLVKVIKVGMTESETRLGVWTDDEYVIVNGAFEWMREDQIAVTGTDDTTNGVGKIPYIYAKDAIDESLVPLGDDDLKAIQIAVGVILTDQSFISKFQTFSAIAVKGAKVDKEYTFSPNSILQIPADGDIKIIKPEADIEKMINFVDKLIVYLLSSKNLKTSDLNATMGNTLSGVAKVVDEATTTQESRNDQQAIFMNVETQYWDLISKYMVPYWIKADMLNPEFRKTFSDSFEVSIQFTEPKTSIPFKEKVENQKLLLDLGLTTERRALREIYDNMTDEEIDDLLLEIRKERAQAIEASQALMNDQSQNDQSNQVEDVSGGNQEEV